MSLEALKASLSDRYRIERQLGQGGMATVYLAADLKHDRQVAIKVLKPELAAVLGAERFVQEIKTTAALQHPHILPLFDSGSAGGFLYYVMPYIEGETLRDRLNREKQLGIDEAVKITIEVADALDYAHRHGVIHRDIKPENILLHDGRPMVADFGIALAVSAAAGGRMTETGLSLGTPHYMSPEQATADREITARSDIYSLASVLYEMLAGEPPHMGNSAQQIIMKIVTDTARPVTELRKSVPPNVAAAVGEALEKLPADRFNTAREFAQALTDVHFSSSAGTAATVGLRLPAANRRQAVLVGLGLILAGVAVGWVARAPRSPPRPGPSFYLTSDSSTRFVGDLAVAPDGETIVFGAAAPGGFQLFAQRLSELDPHPIPGTSGGWSPSFSPDGQRLAYVGADGQIRSQRLDGSEASASPTVTERLSGLAWGDGTTLYFLSKDRWYRVSAQGGAPLVVSSPVQRGGPWENLADPVVFPGGRLVCVRYAGFARQLIGWVTPTDGKFHPVREGSQPRFVPPDLLVFRSVTGDLMVQPFDAARGDTTGPARRLLGQVPAMSAGVDAYAVSASGTLVVLPHPASMSLELISRSGQIRVLGTASRFWVPRFSPDGRRVIYGGYAGHDAVMADLWSYDLRLQTTQRITSGGASGADYNDPTPSPDGTVIALSAVDSTGKAGKQLFLMPADGHSRPARLLNLDGFNAPTGWTPDGRNLITINSSVSGSGIGAAALASVWLVPIDSGRGAPRPLVQEEFAAYGGRVSPDGHWLAYQADATGQNEIYVQPFPGPGARVRVSVAGGHMPVWAPNGRELFYLAGDTLVSAEVVPGRSFDIRARHSLFTVPVGDTFLASYDVSPDGTQFVFAVVPDTPPRLAVFTDALAEVRR